MKIHPALLEAISEKNEYRDKISPLATILLLTDLTSQEIEDAIDKLDIRAHDRVLARFNNANFYLRHHLEKLYKLEKEQPNDQRPPMKYYTIKEFAALTKASESHIRNLVDNHLLPFTDFAGKDRKNRLIRISEKDLDEFLKHKG